MIKKRKIRRECKTTAFYIIQSSINHLCSDVNLLSRYSDGERDNWNVFRHTFQVAIYFVKARLSLIFVVNLILDNEIFKEFKISQFVLPP